jgi:hypothetical protein
MGLAIGKHIQGPPQMKHELDRKFLGFRQNHFERDGNSYLHCLRDFYP